MTKKAVTSFHETIADDIVSLAERNRSNRAAICNFVKENYAVGNNIDKNIVAFLASGTNEGKYYKDGEGAASYYKLAR